VRGKSLSESWIVAAASIGYCSMSTASTWRLVLAVVMAAVASPAHAQTPPDEVPVRLPEGYDPNQPAPLIIALHGYTGSGNNSFSSLFGLWPMASEMGFLYASPTGSQDPLGNNYWNATDACCDFFNANIRGAQIAEYPPQLCGESSCAVSPPSCLFRSPMHHHLSDASVR
jgi:poly(3-hydroxybutyrate) depolymerase